eukprot:TRINITY_DN4225_c0_g1_i1.p1 TRINITY_DN4225_c0_g1~~TRINITY_DN4225_c0_g1_i1.p1  ORF type:complete len:645 (+),score=104.75 TRINITY_DN4225_c0_g1_i1:69-2003(+)
MSEEFLAKPTPIQIQWNIQDYTVKKKTIGLKGTLAKCIKRFDDSTSLKLIQDAVGCLEPGSTLAIMGPSGSGKTTMLSILSGRIKPHLYNGSVVINGQPTTRKLLKRVVGFVPQDDILLGSQTVRESLQFVANLKLSHLSQSERDARVQSIIDELGLRKCSDSLVGYVGADALNSGLKRGISGGERKRLSVGLELISNPSLLFLDEPTTGLDSFSAFSVVSTLSKLGSTGRTVIYTIHQPSAEIMDQFDKLLLIGRGRVMYFGPSKEVIPYFKKIGYPCPVYENPADFLLRIVHEEDKPESIDANQNLDEKDIETNFDAKEDKQVEILNSKYQESELCTRAQVAEPPPPAVDMSTRSSKAGYFIQFILLFKRYMQNLLREPQAARAGVFQNVVIGLIMGFTFYKLDYSYTGVLNRTGGLFFGAVFIMFGGILGPFISFPTERRIFMREYLSGLYSPSMYYSAKVLAEEPIFLMTAIVFSCIFYWLVGFAPSADRFFIFLLVCYLLLNVAFGFGIMIIAIFPDPAVALNVFPMVFIPLMIFSGFYLNSHNTPKYFIWIEYLSYLKYGFRALMVNEFRGYSFYCKPRELAFLQSSCPFTTGDDVLAHYYMNNMPIVGDILIVVLMILFYHSVSFLILRSSARSLKS